MLKIKSIKPMFDSLITTMNKYEEDGFENGVIVKQAGSLKEYQKVIAVGPAVRNIEVGDMVMINPTRYGRRKHQAGSLKYGIVEDNPITEYNIPTIELDHVKHLLLFDQDIDFVISDYSEEPDPPKKVSGTEQKIILPDSNLIV